jgi:hypothetical protein
MTRYEYIATYVDDIVCLYTDPKVIMITLENTYILKKGSVGPPEQSLSVTVKPCRFDEDPMKVRWGLPSEEYVAAAIANVEHELEQAEKALSRKVSTPMQSGYRPELDVTPLLGDEQANYYQNLIGVLRWTVELGHIDIHIGVSNFSRYLVQPHTGHFQAVFHVLAYIKEDKRCTVVFDDTRLTIA